MLAHHPVRGDGLLERDSELAALDRALERAVAGCGQMLAIVGPAGIGKSSLLGRARQAAGERGLRLLTASGSKLERSFPFGLCRQLFEPVLRRADASDREAMLAGAAAIAGHLLLAPPGSSGPDGSGFGPSGTLDRLPGATASMDAYAPLHGLYWLAANLADQEPLLIAVDDAHWADAPSLHLLNYLARRLDALPIAAVVGAREAELGVEEDLLQSVLAAPEVHVLRPASLSEPATAALIEDAFGTEPGGDFAVACRQATGGNPFYLAELLRALNAAGVAPTTGNTKRVTGIGPPAISREVLGRVAYLGPAAVALVRAIAVLGGSAELSVAAELAGLDGSEAVTVVDELSRAAILPGGPRPHFAHPIMQAAVYEDIPPYERGSAHRRAAGLLAARSAGRSDVAVHLLHTPPGREPWTLALVRWAADEALAKGAPQVAIDYLRRGLAESPSPTERFELLSTLGPALTEQGAVEGIEVMHSAVEAAPEPAARARVAIPLASALVYAGRAGEAVAVLENALKELDELGGAQSLAAQLEGLLCVMGITELDARRHLRGRLARTVERFQTDPCEIPEPVLPPLALELINTGSPAIEAAGLAMRALRTGDFLNCGLVYSPLPYVAAYVLISTDRPRLAERWLDEAAERATRQGAAGGFTVISATRSLARLRRGDLRGAQADAEFCLHIFTEHQPEIFAPIALAVLVTGHIERGELAQAHDTMALPMAANFEPEGVLTQPLVEARARLRFAEGDDVGGLQELERCREWSAGWGEESGSWPVQWRSAMALGELHRGNASRAKELAAEDVELARRFGAPRSLGRSLVALGLSERGEARIALLRGAVDALEGSEDRLEHARALVELGAALRRRGERTAAREPLMAAMKMGRGCGATTLAERAYDELRAAGARPPKIVHGGLEALTASELRVAKMAAGGMTNREVAQSLFVTQKTVEIHLSHAYQKLDITSRHGLPSMLGTYSERPREGNSASSR